MITRYYIKFRGLKISKIIMWLVIAFLLGVIIYRLKLIFSLRTDVGGNSVAFDFAVFWYQKQGKTINFINSDGMQISDGKFIHYDDWNCNADCKNIIKYVRGNGFLRVENNNGEQVNISK